MAELAGSEGLGVLKAPVDDRCNRSNSSCSFGGRRGGEGPVANAVRYALCENRRLEGIENFRDNNRDISLTSQCQLRNRLFGIRSFVRVLMVARRHEVERNTG